MICISLRLFHCTQPTTVPRFTAFIDFYLLWVLPWLAPKVASYIPVNRMKCYCVHTHNTRVLADNPTAMSSQSGTVPLIPSHTHCVHCCVPLTGSGVSIGATILSQAGCRADRIIRRPTIMYEPSCCPLSRPNLHCLLIPSAC
jgi:hypothetical protein